MEGHGRLTNSVEWIRRLVRPGSKLIGIIVLEAVHGLKVNAIRLPGKTMCRGRPGFIRAYPVSF
jgi:hypothetical protein